MTRKKTAYLSHQHHTTFIQLTTRNHKVLFFSVPALTSCCSILPHGNGQHAPREGCSAFTMIRLLTVCDATNTRYSERRTIIIIIIIIILFVHKTV